MAGMTDAGALAIAIAIYFGLKAIANAIEYRADRMAEISESEEVQESVRTSD